MRTPPKRLAWAVDVPFQCLVDMKALDHPQQYVLSIQAKNQDIPLLHNIVITVEKTYSSNDPRVVPLLETTLRARMKHHLQTVLTIASRSGRGMKRVDLSSR